MQWPAAEFPLHIVLPAIVGNLLLALSPGPDNILTMSYGLSRGTRAAALCALGCIMGVYAHVIAAALGLAVLIARSPLAFTFLQIAGAAYLLWLAWQALRSEGLLRIQASADAAHASLWQIWRTGFLSAALNPKPVLFLLALLPQLARAERGSVGLQMLVYGGIFVACAFVVFVCMGAAAARLQGFFQRRPRALRALNIVVALVLAGFALSVLSLARVYA